MNFKFKLSRRLAVLPSLLLTATAVATGCITQDILDPTLHLVQRKRPPASTRWRPGGPGGLTAVAP